MSEAAAAPGQGDELDELDAKPREGEALSKFWQAELRAALKQHAKWHERGKKIEKIYRDERDDTASRARRFNILWANVETLRPSVYMQTPKPAATRRYRQRDPIARLAATMLERCLATSCELYGFDHTMEQAVRDWLLPGRGQVWLFYEPTFYQAEDKDETTGAPLLGEDGASATYDALEYEQVVADYLPWRDFLHSVSRTWEEVRWVARRLLFTKRRGLKRFGDKFKTVPLALKPERDDRAEGDGASAASQAEIYEVWDKESGEVLFVALDVKVGGQGGQETAILERKPAPVKFRDFFPCPRPLSATTTSGSLIPTPDYAQYQDQAQELNTLTARIDRLQKALKVAGLYPKELAEIGRLLEAGEGKMIAVDQWALLQEEGGVKGLIEWYPVDKVITVLRELYAQRDQAKQVLFEISGIADVMRGATDPGETLGAQKLKTQWGGGRVRKRQKEVQRFAADIMRLKAELIAEVFQFSTIQELAGVDREMLAKYTPAGMDPRAVLAACEQLLRSDASRTFHIKVETDSTLEPDEQHAQESVAKMLASVSMIMEKGAPLAAAGPEGAKLVGEMLLTATRTFKQADALEEIVQQAVEAATKASEAKAKAPAKPDPEMEKVKLQAAKIKSDAALGAEKVKIDRERLELERQQNGREMILKAQSLKHTRHAAQIQMEREDAFKRHEVEARTRPATQIALDANGAAQQAFGGMAEGLTAIAQALTQAAQMMARAAEAQEHAARLAAAPKRSRVVRGADGRAVAVESETVADNGEPILNGVSA